MPTGPLELTVRPLAKQPADGAWALAYRFGGVIWELEKIARITYATL
jgi:hypothetical protein